MNKRVGTGQLGLRAEDLGKRIANLEDEVEDLYVQYFEDPYEDEFVGHSKLLARVLKRIASRINDMAHVVGD